MVRLTEFDTSAFLDDDELVAEYLTAALEDGKPDVFLVAMANAARARGIPAVADHADLHGALTPGAKPSFDTVKKLLQRLGMKLSVSVG
ncbi:MAG: putative addiction module antidote protein [Gammaproteobacteria bacterium]|nr:putative addiction module antidote protein [Gammaproteobacteria bacterium]